MKASARFLVIVWAFVGPLTVYSTWQRLSVKLPGFRYGDAFALLVCLLALAAFARAVEATVLYGRVHEIENGSGYVIERVDVQVRSRRTRVTWWSLLFGVSVYPRGTKWLHLGPLKLRFWPLLPREKAERLRWWYHPRQEWRCRLASFFLGRRVSSGVDGRHEYGTNHWWSCSRCGEHDESL